MLLKNAVGDSFDMICEEHARMERPLHYII